MATLEYLDGGGADILGSRSPRVGSGGGLANPPRDELSVQPGQ